jgi:hypothetical protein
MIRGHGIATLQRKFEEVPIAVERRRTRNRHTTGKSIESIIVKSRRAWLASALSVVVNCKGRGRAVRRKSELVTDHHNHHSPDGR